MNHIKKIGDFFETINLGDYDLEGVEFTEDDFVTIAERLKNSNKTLEEIVDKYLYEIREVLDIGLEEQMNSKNY